MKTIFSRFQQTLIILALVHTCANVFAQSVVRGPYLQEMSESSVIVRWRTDIQTDAVVRYGSSQGNLNLSENNGVTGIDHEVEISDLLPQTTYFYSVGTAGSALAGDGSYFFKTAPADGQNASTKMWVVGDSGTANSDAEAVRDAFIQHTNGNMADIMLMLGDNAYPDGTDEEYQSAMFDMYPTILRRLPVWSTLGNHDGRSADSATQSGAYYDMFTLPDNAQLGGVASGTEAYYSFERDNIHFVVLNSFDVDRSEQSPMLTWLQNDLNANTKQWVIAMWHHPPYSRGSHNSDEEGRLIDMRENALPILENLGVDLVLSGHSHAYERSFLLDGHYGFSDTLDPAHIVDGGDGNDSGDGHYHKPDSVASPHEGAVYAVAGSSGKISGGSLNHPVMFVSLNTLGSMIIEIQGPRLDAVFINSTAQVQDSFTIIKGTGDDVTPPQIADAFVASSTEVEVIFSESMDTASVENTANYVMNLGVSVLSSVYSAVNNSVTLTTTALIPNLDYTLTINSVSDTSSNVIANNSSAIIVYTSSSQLSFVQGQFPTSFYSGNVDTYISSASPDSNFGSSDVLLLDGDDPAGSDNDLSTLIRYDISSIPENATVNSVRIILDVFNSSTNSYDVFPLLKTWNESSASWNESESGVQWEAPGALGTSDRSMQSVAVLSSPPVSSSYNLVFNQFGVDLVQSWVDGSAQNFGFVIGSATSGDGVDFRSSEAAAWQSRPRLMIGITLPTDTDSDGVDDQSDNCLLVANSVQLDSDSDGYGNACDADFDNNCVVNFLDFQLMTQAFLGNDALYDLNADGLINFIDFALFSPRFLLPPGPSTQGSCP